MVPEAEHCARTAPNQALEPTPKSVRSYVAPATGRGSPPAFGHSAMVKQGVTKIMENVMPFGEVLEAVDKLSLEEQEALVGVLHRRLIERRREELAKDVQHAQQEFEAGQCRPVTAAELMKEIVS